MTATADPNAAAPAPAPAPVSPELTLKGAWPYVLAASLIALAQGLGQGFISANLSQMAGDLGITTTEASWMMAAYMVPRSALPIILMKLRTQYGLRRFAEVGIIAFVLASFASIWISDLRSAIVVQFLSGLAAAPLSTLAFLYMLDNLPEVWKLRFGLPAVMTFMLLGTPLARVISPALMQDAGTGGLHLLMLGLALVMLGLIYVLPLRPVPHAKVIAPLDLVSFGLISAGFAGLTVAAIQGPIHWWTDTAWVAIWLAGGIAALALAAMIELNRKVPLMDIRWLVSPAMLHLTGALFLFRLILSEQSAGAPRMFMVLGVGPGQMVPLFTVISVATVMGGLACIAWIAPRREVWFHLAALVLIAAGAWMDSQSTVDTRPQQFIISQAMIGCAGMLFMPPAMMAGLLSALARGPAYILSFVIIFISTQSLGGILGSGLFTSIINYRQAFHMRVLAEQLDAGAARSGALIGQVAATLSPQISDPALRQAGAVTAIGRQVAQQAWVLAYNDAYFLTFLVAVAALAALLLHLLRDWLAQAVFRIGPPQPHHTAAAQTPPQAAAPR
ncbi:MFS transporter [Paracoccus jiaweipingae]|uniref:MFS transporter n=1 Tax=unclassified Paracoccus (in: a-proteobacteria) TaxID=2688777 RepID=UPI00379BF369